MSSVLKLCSQRIYLLKLLRDQGIPSNCLNCVFHSLILSGIEYALPVRGGYLNAEHTCQINSFLRIFLCMAFAKLFLRLNISEKSDNKMLLAI